MHRRTPATRPLLRGGALATAALTLAAVAASAAGALPASADDAPTAVSLFPTDAATVPDAAQATGRRVALPLPQGCADNPGTPACGLVAGLDELDGFDLDPRLALSFNAPVSVDDAIASTTVSGNGLRFGIDRVVYDPDNHVVYAHPTHQLDPHSTYTLAVSSAHGLPASTTTFTTMSAPDGLMDLRRQLDNGSAYTAAGIAPADRGLTIDAVVPTDQISKLEYNADTGSGALVTAPVPVVASGTVVFGSFLAPSWLRSDGTIAQTPTKDDGPAAVGSARLPFIAVVPLGKPPVGGWPTTLFGHGFTRSDADVFPASLVAVGGGEAVVATDVVGHGYGPRSTWTITTDSGARTVSAYGRGVDADGNGTIGNTEGSSTLPSGAAAAVSSRDGLRETAADNMTLLRAIAASGLDITGTPASDLRRTDISYFGQSFGGIYGGMLAGADPKVYRSVLNVAGGPVTEVARLSPSFRPLVEQSLAYAGLLNSSDDNRDKFEEDLPLRGQAPVLAPVPGALAIQQFLALTTWLDRSGGPETYAPRIPKNRVLFQVAYGDQTVPNPTAYTLLDAGYLFQRAALYRNDRTAAAGKNPHGFLLDIPTFGAAALGAQNQVLSFLTTGKIVDPDGSRDVWQVPAPKPVLRSLNFADPAFP